MSETTELCSLCFGLPAESVDIPEGCLCPRCAPIVVKQAKEMLSAEKRFAKVKDAYIDRLLSSDDYLVRGAAFQALHECFSLHGLQLGRQGFDS